MTNVDDLCTTLEFAQRHVNSNHLKALAVTLKAWQGPAHGGQARLTVSEFMAIFDESKNTVDGMEQWRVENDLGVKFADAWVSVPCDVYGTHVVGRYCPHHGVVQK